MSQQDVQTVLNAYSAIGRLDIESFLQALDADIEWFEPENPDFAIGGTYRGHQEVLTALGFIPANFDKFDVTPHEVLDVGDRVIAFGAYRLRAKTTQQSVDVPYTHVWTFRNGQATRFQVFSDRGKIIHAMAGTLT
jgi:ketosteroid isomerase-like protein